MTSIVAPGWTSPLSMCSPAARRAKAARCTIATMPRLSRHCPSPLPSAVTPTTWPPWRDRPMIPVSGGPQQYRPTPDNQADAMACPLQCEVRGESASRLGMHLNRSFCACSAVRPMSRTRGDAHPSAAANINPDTIDQRHGSSSPAIGGITGHGGAWRSIAWACGPLVVVKTQCPSGLGSPGCATGA